MSFACLQIFFRGLSTPSLYEIIVSAQNVFPAPSDRLEKEIGCDNRNKQYDDRNKDIDVCSKVEHNHPVASFNDICSQVIYIYVTVQFTFMTNFTITNLRNSDPGEKQT